MLEPGKEGQAERWPLGQRPHTVFMRTELHGIEDEEDKIKILLLKGSENLM